MIHLNQQRSYPTQQRMLDELNAFIRTHQQLAS